MSENTKISLKAARINADLSQKEAASKLTKYMGLRISRQRVAFYEKHSDKIPPAFANAFSVIYKLPVDDIFFANESTES